MRLLKMRMQSAGRSKYWSRGRQPTVRVPRLARQAISNGTEKLLVLHVTFVTIHTEGRLTLTCTNIRMLLAH